MVVWLDVELEQHDIAVGDHVLLAFHAVQTLVAGGGDRTARDQIRIGDGLRLDEAALEVGVDDAGRLRRGVAVVDRPGPDLLLAGGEVGLQAEQVIRRPDQRAGAAFLDAELLEERLGLIRATDR